MTRLLRAADLFCGAGGTSEGAERSGAAKVICAVNHWKVAVDTHSANFPHTKHINSRLDQVNPGECDDLDVIFASPECTDHSRARGGRPTNDQRRCGAWDIMKWLDFHRPGRLIVENVPEFNEWGPVGDNGRPLKKFRGRFFSAWVDALRSAGYRVDDRLLNAADYGAATSRTRLFVVARKGNRPVNWPEPTHARHSGGELPGMEMQPWRSAAEIIDWEIPCRSVFLRKEPLSDNTLNRIEAGLRKFVGPYVVLLRNNSTATNPSDPLSTITAGGKHHGLAIPFQFKAMGNCPGLTRSIDQPLKTITAAKRGQAVVIPFLVSYYANGKGHSLLKPIGTLTTRDRYGIAYAVVELAGKIRARNAAERRLLATMKELGVADVCYRMLVNPELSLATGFRPEYIFCGNKGDVTRQIGNAVCPDVAEALTMAAAA